jgi:two-component system, cell cycle sensor histidine kinase and response regulator CckA
MDCSFMNAQRGEPPSEGVLLEKLARQVPGVLYQYRLFPDGRSCFPFASAGMCEVYEVDPAAVLDDATPVFGRLHPDDLQRVGASIQESAATLQPWRCVYRVQLPRGGERWLRGDANPERLDDGSVLWHGHITDITETEHARERLRESEARYRILADYAPEAIVLLDVEHDRFVDVNPKAERLVRLAREELLRRKVSAFSAPIQPDGRRAHEVLGVHTAQILAGELKSFEWLLRLDDGEELLCEVRIVPLPWEGRTLLRGSLTDIRERKRLENTMRQLETAISSSLSAIAVADLQGNLTYVNRAFLQIWGYAHESQILGRPAVSFWSNPADAQHVVHSLMTHGSWRGELVARHQDGSDRTLTLQASVFRNAGGEPLGLLASFVDITEERRLQMQLQQAQRLETVGRLAGGVAHDFNNLLTVMKGYLELSTAALPPDAALVANLLEIDHAVDSAASLTQQLLAFSRQQIITPRILDVDALVRRTLGMLRRLLGEHIVLEYVPGNALGSVRFDPGQAEQILVNLAVNARDAMPDGGQLTIETANIVLDDAYALRHPGVVAGEYVMLTISDTGAGMSADTREHAFEPFYTTKLPGRGTGLGLAMIHGSISQHGGHIEVYSELGVGTTFRIHLPRVEAAAVVEAPVVRGDVPGGGERILLVEDDPRLRRLAERLLRQFGYAVFPMSHGDEALAWLEREDAAVDLLLTDVIMPGMNGKVLAERVEQLRPGVRILFMSGYTANVIVHHGVLKEGVEFLPKPFTMMSLATRVREVLDTGR